MRKIDYREWAEYLRDLIFDEINNPKNVLELGCGNCVISNLLAPHFPKMIVTDISKNMLVQSNNSKLQVVCNDMKALPFKEKFSVVFSAFDTVNYLMTEAELKKLYVEVSRVLEDDGIFTFDASLLNNSLKNIKHLNRSGKVDGIRYIQQSVFDNEEKIHYNNLKFILGNGEEITEVHEQKIFDFETYFYLAEETDLYVSSCYDSFSFDNASSTCERVQFVLKKK